MKTVVFQLGRLGCPSCIHEIEETLMEQEGVRFAKVLFHSNRVKVNYDDAVISKDMLVDLLTSAGHPSLSLVL